MTHLTDLECQMLADDALTLSERDDLMSHVNTCEACAARLAVAQADGQLLREALQAEEAIAVPTAAPAFRQPLSLRNLALANLATGLVIWFAQFLWKTLFGELIVSAFTRLTAFYIPDTYDLVVGTALYFFEEGTTMIDNYIEAIVAVMLLAGIAWLTAYLNRRQVMMVSLLLVSGLSLVTPQEAGALEVRRGETITIVNESETLSDSVFAAGETILVDGTVEGDVLAFGRRVIINGEIKGNLVTAAETISIFGNVTGSVASAGSIIEVMDGRIGGDLWSAAEDVTIDDASMIARNATMAGESIRMAGTVGSDVWGFAETIEVSGLITENLEAFAHRINLISDARIDGDLRIRTRNDNSLQQSDDAVIAGQVEYLDLPEEMNRNRYTTGGFYFRALLSLIAAFIVGMTLIYLFPQLRYTALESGPGGFRQAAFGLIALVSAPIILLLMAITLVGLPLAVIGFLLWGITIYLAKILVASVIGNMLFDDESRGAAIPLLVGLVIMTVAVNLPGIGGIFSFLLTVVGFGLIVTLLSDTWART